MFDFKQILEKRGFGAFSQERAVLYMIFILIFIFLALLLGDAIIFWRHYEIIVQSPQAGALPETGISRPNLERSLEIIRSRESAQR